MTYYLYASAIAGGVTAVGLMMWRNNALGGRGFLQWLFGRS